MIINILKFLKSSKGAISIEFAGVFAAFTAVLFIGYDIYNSISLQNNLERTNYTVASLIRERSSLYTRIDDSISRPINGTSSHPSLCDVSSESCFKTYELVSDEQLVEAQNLASKLLNKEVSIRIDSLFLLQHLDFPGDLNKAKLKNFTLSSCDNNNCDDRIKNFLDSRSNMEDRSVSERDYTKLIPFVSRTRNIDYPHSNITGRFIPLYRVSMCINNAESFFLKFHDSSRQEKGILPNLCSEISVISRCNDLTDPQIGCPIYVYR